MIIKARNKKILFQNNNNFELILADINYLPLKRNSIDHIISISAYNFITYNRNNERDKIKTINNTAKYLYKVLKSESGRIVIEFYPKDDEELDLFVSSFKKNGFDGYLIKSKPNQKAGQTYLNLKKIR
jgi:ubiquinone/menaquinone biosynthesis C-methylase UbiE